IEDSFLSRKPPIFQKIFACGAKTMEKYTYFQKISPAAHFFRENNFYNVFFATENLIVLQRFHIKFAGRDENSPDGTGRDEILADETGRDGTGRNLAGRDGTGREFSSRFQLCLSPTN